MTKAFQWAVPLCFAAATAWASPATTVGAKYLTEVFQTYFGTLPGVVAVVPQADTYAVTLNAAPLIALVAEDGQQASMTPLVLTLTDQGAGLWGVVVDQALDITVGGAGMPTLQLSIGHILDKGTFDAALRAFSAETGQIENLSWSQSMAQETDGMGAARWDVASLTYQATSTAAPTGGLDRVMHVTLPEAVESLTISEGPGDDMPMGLTIKDYNFDWTMKGYRAAPVLDLLAFVVANAAEGRIEQNLPELKTLATAALPLFDSITSTGTTGTIQAATPWGDFSMDGSATAVDLHGAVADGMFREGVAVRGLKIPSGLVPDWAASLLPTEAGFDLAVSGYDARAAADLALGLLDQPLGQDPPADFEDQLLTAALPNGTVTIALSPSTISAPGYSLAYEGTLQVGPATDIPTGSAKFTLTGMDAVIAALNAAPDDIKRDVVPAAMLIRGMAKAGPDGALIWEIDGSVPGKLLVNGNDVMSLMQ